MAENSAAGTNVGDPVTATDSGDTLTYTLEGPDAASFDIVLTSGQIRTKSGVTYDYETKSSYAVIVRAEDRNGGSDTIAVTITVTDAPPAFQAASTTREVAENSAAGTNVGDPVTATATGDTLTYTLEGPAAASFEIVSTSGQIRTKSGVTYDYETKSSYEVVVRAEDRNGGSDTIDVTITVTDVDDSPAVRAWLGRFGRTVSGQVLDAVEERLRASRAAGVSVRVAGQSIDLATKAAPEDEAEKESRSRLAAVSDRLGLETQDGKRAGMQSRTPTGPEAMMGSSFALAAKTDGGGSSVVWGRMAYSRFSGRTGGLSLDGDVTTGLLGAEYAHGPLAGGAVLSNSRGKGGYGGDAGGRVAASMTALTPWAGYKVSERLSVWGALGFGAGELTLTPKEQLGQNTDLAMRLAAGGARGTVVDGDGPKLDAVADARWVRTTSEKDGYLAATSADVTRLRLGLEGSWAMTFDDQGATVTPRLSFGVRHDGGDAETGFGADIGGGVLLAMPARGLSVSLEGRGLLTHEAKGFSDTGFGGIGRVGSGAVLEARAVAHGAPQRRRLGHRRQGRAVLARGHGRAGRQRQPAPGGQGRLRAGGVWRAVHRHAGARLRAVGQRPGLEPRLAPDARGPRCRVVRGFARDDAARDRQRQRSGTRHRVPTHRALVGDRAAASRRDDGPSGRRPGHGARSLDTPALGATRRMPAGGGRPNSEGRAVALRRKPSPMRMRPPALPGDVGGRPGACFPARSRPRRPLSDRCPAPGDVLPSLTGSVPSPMEASDTHISVV